MIYLFQIERNKSTPFFRDRSTLAIVELPYAALGFSIVIPHF